MNKIKLGLLFGGKSFEHKVSLRSAKNIFDAIDKEKYSVFPIGIDKNGIWYLYNTDKFLLNENDPKNIKLEKNNRIEIIFTGKKKKQFISLKKNIKLDDMDVFFPIMHGIYGEDGIIQGILKSSNVPFIGASVIGSAIGMDKDIMKRLLRDSKIAVSDFISFNFHEKKNIDFNLIKNKLKIPFFVKPANSGSSIGINKVNNFNEFNNAIKEAFKYDNKIIIEQFIDGRELECAVIGNEIIEVSSIGEIIPENNFYSYRSKYIDEFSASIIIPAKLNINISNKIKNIVKKAYKVLCCNGMARIDLFLDKNNNIFINEINTIPGFTKISMFPMLWKNSGISYKDLITKIIELAFEQNKKTFSLNTSLME